MSENSLYIFLCTASSCRAQGVKFQKPIWDPTQFRGESQEQVRRLGNQNHYFLTPLSECLQYILDWKRKNVYKSWDSCGVDSESGKVSPKGRHLTKNNLGDLFSLNSSVLKFCILSCKHATRRQILAFWLYNRIAWTVTQNSAFPCSFYCMFCLHLLANRGWRNAGLGRFCYFLFVWKRYTNA